MGEASRSRLTVQKHEIRLNYQQATQLAQVGRYDEALEILVELDEIKPNTEGILYLMAACQAKAGRKQEALKLCDRLIEEFDHEHAKQMKKRLTTRSATADRLKARRSKSFKQVKQETSTPSPEENDAPTSSVELPDTNDAKESDAASREDISPQSAPGEGEPPEETATAEDDQENAEHDDGPPPDSEEIEDWDEENSSEDSDAREISQEPEQDKPPAELIQTRSRQKPLWLILLISGTAAAVVAILFHVLNKIYMFI